MYNKPKYIFAGNLLFYVYMSPKGLCTPSWACWKVVEYWRYCLIMEIMLNNVLCPNVPQESTYPYLGLLRDSWIMETRYLTSCWGVGADWKRVFLVPWPGSAYHPMDSICPSLFSDHCDMNDFSSTVPPFQAMQPLDHGLQLWTRPSLSSFKLSFQVLCLRAKWNDQDTTHKGIAQFFLEYCLIKFYKLIFLVHLPFVKYLFFNPSFFPPIIFSYSFLLGQVHLKHDFFGKF